MSKFIIKDKTNPQNTIIAPYRGSDTDLYTPVSYIVGETALHNNGVPICLEVQGWGELACIGDIWENDRLTIELVEQ